MSKQKAQGTRHESWLVAQLHEAGYTAKRIAEGGSADEGDIEVWFGETKWVLECKATQNLNVQDTLGKARSKAKSANGGVATPVAVVWKRLVKIAESSRRKSVRGEAVVVTVSIEDFLSLLPKKEAPND